TRLVLTLFFATGAAALALEVAWIRLFTLVIGTSLYSFALTVGSFLAALGTGSAFMRARADTLKNPAPLLARIMILTGLAGAGLLLLAPVWERIYFAAYHASSSITLFQTALFALGFLSILIPGGLMGAGFCVAVHLMPATESDTAPAVGRLYGVNTLGGVLG